MQVGVVVSVFVDVLQSKPGMPAVVRRQQSSTLLQHAVLSHGPIPARAYETSTIAALSCAERPGGVPVRNAVMLVEQ